MHTWKTLEQDIERFFKRAQKESLDIEEIWDIYEEGLFLQQSLDELLPNSNREEIVSVIEPLVRGQHSLQDHLLKHVHADRGTEVREWLNNRVLLLEKRSRHVMGDVAHNRITIAAELQSIANELFFLRRMARRIHEGNDNILHDISNEIHYLVMQSHEQKHLFSDKIVQSELLNLRTQILSKELDEFREKTTENIENKTGIDYLSELWNHLRWGGEIQPKISRSEEKHQKILVDCKEEREKVKVEMENVIANLTDEERWQFIEKVIIDAQDIIDDVLVSVEEQSLRIGIKSLAIVNEDLLWLRHIIKPYFKKEVSESLKKQYKKYLARHKFFNKQFQDKQIQYRMEKIFGYKFVKFFERLILWLILAVILLLIVEEVGNFLENKHIISAHMVFVYVDTCICAIFLFEFFTKLILAHKKWLYFRRHWFTDLLPSIPFSFLSEIPALSKFVSGKADIVRVIRIVRIFRVVTFLIRGLDAFVRSYGGWFNRNIVFFGDSKEIKTKNKLNIPDRIHVLRNVCLNRSRSIFHRVYDDNLRIPFMISYLKTLEIQMEKNVYGSLGKGRKEKSSDILVENVIQNMIHITGEQVEEAMGYEFPIKTYRYFRVLNIPLIRALPFIKTVVQNHRENDAMGFTAWLGRRVGRFFEKVLALIYWLVDLYGVLSPPRVLDRIGNTLVESFKRPALRLILIGGGFVFLRLLFITWPWLPLGEIVGFLNKFIGTPLLVIGGVCSIPVIIGMWLRSIAGEATEFLMRTAEAQFINLLEDIKVVHSERDMRILYERVMGPELEMLKGVLQKEDGEKWMTEQWKSSLEVGACIEDGQCDVTTIKQARLWNRQRPVFLLYRDYLDGAPLHRSDVKTTEQLLGNIAIENIRKHRVEYHRKESKALDKLDLETGKSLLGGPYLWFSFLTQSISHNVASLLVEYNKNAIPESLLRLQKSENLVKYQKWLQWRLQDEWDGSKSELSTIQKDMEKKEDGAKNHKKKKRKKKHIDTNPVYTTTRFNALHFLTLSREQDQSIRLTFGDDLYKAFIKDRRQNIRYIFGTYPLYLLPATQRKLNPYNLYLHHMAGGKIFALPFKIIAAIFKVIGLTLNWVYQKIREIVDPELQAKPPQIKADFDVVVRKINRMRKPVYIECMRLRARYDFEYLGLEFEGFPGLSTQEKNFRSEFLENDEERNWLGLFEKDLDFISALDSEKDYFFELYTRRKERLESFNTFLERRGWDNGKFQEYITTLDSTWGPRSNEILRALAIAYSINYKKLPSLLSAAEVLENAFYHVIEHLGYNKEDRFYKKIFRFFYRGIKTCGFIIKDRDRRDFETFWSQSKFAQAPRKHKKWCWRTYLVKRSQLKDALYFLTESGDVSIAEEIIQDIISNPTPWTEELLAIRTVQTLSVLDVLNYRGHVALLGDYPEKEIYSK